MRWTGARVRNGFLRLAHRLPRHGENVWAGVPNDLFVAHLSIYEFAASRARGRVLDLGCGTGYGAERLAGEPRVESVLALDIESRNLRYAHRRYRTPGLAFRRQDVRRLCVEGRFDHVVCSNVLEHLDDPDLLIGRIRSYMQPNGRWIVAVPPIRGDRELELNRANPYHLCNRTIEEWVQSFERAGWEAKLYRHWHPEIERLDFASPLRSRWSPDDFLFEPVSLEEMYRLPTLSAVFELS